MDFGAKDLVNAASINVCSAEVSDQVITELAELELAVVGGGIGDTIAA